MDTEHKKDSAVIVAEGYYRLKAENEKLRELLKECREEIEGLDHGEGAPGMSTYQRQLLRTLDDVLANNKGVPHRPAN